MSSKSDRELAEQEAIPGEQAYNNEDTAHLNSSVKNFMTSGESDVTKLKAPVWINEGDSMISRNLSQVYTDHFLDIPLGSTPEERLLRAMRFFFSHFSVNLLTKKKPFNPITGEFFRGSYSPGENSPHKGRKIVSYSELINHRPIVIGFHMEDVPTEEGGQPTVQYYGAIEIQAGFSGMTIRVKVLGDCFIRLPQHNETYRFNLPLSVLRGLLVGKSFMDMNGETKFECLETGLSASINFKEKPWFFGQYRNISATVRNAKDKKIYKLDGNWGKSIDLENLETGEKVPNFFLRDVALEIPVTMAPVEEMEELESVRLWEPVVTPLRAGDNPAAERAKDALEHLQRVLLKEVDENRYTYEPILFAPGPEEEIKKSTAPTFVLRPDHASRVSRSWLPDMVKIASAAKK
ncbi:hypothetical protein H696_01762 [Fonticula alba]|uniref:Oxysterol-binding protein n=1 Tax=Fonticula alba TaxID=691883 RepID=A0A058ZDA5_FONAL|nr:hypothetical protein H696_01762 [Fonticula alba]KCV72369.1 hypothetical protein H696_01762 [Fonticula alba]|eukprot:XP_009493947.1 hypothetical protein H696_01762 [Fonticula alba]